MVSPGTYQVATLLWRPLTEYIRGVVVNHVKSEQKVAICCRVDGSSPPVLADQLTLNDAGFLEVFVSEK